MTTRKMTQEQRREAARQKAEELQEQLARDLEELTTSEDWMAALEVASRFHRYSFQNVMLILGQRPDASRVAGFRKWQELGRQVRKGETAIRIFAPMVKRIEVEDEDGEVEVRRRVSGFRLVPVFDIAQTDGEDLAEPIRPELLLGSAPEQMIERVGELIAGEGFELTADAADWAPGLNGRTDFGSKTVTIRAELEPAQRAKTLVHELAHVRMHRPGMTFDRSTGEVEAESVAYIVCRALGLETDAYTLPYVGSWSGGDVDKVRATGQRVVEVARALIEELEPADQVEVKEAA